MIRIANLLFFKTIRLKQVLLALLVASFVVVVAGKPVLSVAGDRPMELPYPTVLVNIDGDTQLTANRIPLKVATKRFEPFVSVESDRYYGFSIDFWNAIAQKLGVDYQLSGVESIDRLLDSVKEETADIAIAGITITAERETVMDFSHPYYESGLQILVPEDSSITQSFGNRIRAIITRPQLYIGIGVFILVLFVAAHVIWFTERRHNPEFPSSYWEGIWESFWWAAVTVTTVGYGDKTPRKLFGRIFGLFWMCAGYFIFAYFTATVTTSFTIDAIDSNIRSIEDLRGKSVATMSGTTTEKYLQEQGIGTLPFENKEAAYEAVANKEVAAMVYDAPALQHYVHHEGKGKVKVIGDLFDPQSYGIALPLNSPYRKPINAAMLQLMEDGTYQEIEAKWFGDE